MPMFFSVLAGIIPLSLRNGGHLIPFAPLSASGGQLPPLTRLRHLCLCVCVCVSFRTTAQRRLELRSPDLVHVARGGSKRG